VDLADFFLVAEAECFFVPDAAVLPEPCPETETAATNRQSNPAKQAVPIPEGKSGGIRTLISPLYAGFDSHNSVTHHSSHFLAGFGPGAGPGMLLQVLSAIHGSSFRMVKAVRDSQTVNDSAELRNQLAWRPSNP
jgi:hypothetical protein